MAARAAQKRRKMTAVINGALSNAQELPGSSPKLTSLNEATDFQVTNPEFYTAGEEMMGRDISMGTDLRPDSFLDFDFALNNTDEYNLINFLSVPPESLVMDRNPNTVGGPDLIDTQNGPPIQMPQSDRNRQMGGGKLSELWHGSPIRLLNCSVITYYLNKSLSQVYDSMMTSMATRYLAHACNQFAGLHRYTIQPENEEDGKFGLSTGERQCAAITTSHTESPGRQYARSVGFVPATVQQSQSYTASLNRQVTLIGVARFLDSFGTLYKNRLSTKEHKLDEETLTAVLQAFALQWVVSDNMPPVSSCTVTPWTENSECNGNNPPSRQFMLAAWFNAHSYLSKSKGNCSFVRVYSAFLFNLIEPPAEACSNADYKDSSLHYLDHALRQLEDLLGLVESFCLDLDANSVYRALLESSARIMRWHGYLRDTIASVSSDRTCILKDAPVQIVGM